MRLGQLFSGQNKNFHKFPRKLRTVVSYQDGKMFGNLHFQGKGVVVKSD
jgi:hypothetical protein